MIVFELACDCGYTFEGWFQDREDFTRQQTASILVCPDCGSRRIRKILSPIRAQSSRDCREESRTGLAQTDIPADPAVAAMESLQTFIQENFEDVGPNLATESLKIHYGVAEPRNLRGVTTEQEEKRLKEEGINLVKIPFPLKNPDAN